MNYIVSSRGRPVGVTDLGFSVVFPRHRIGWLYPNAHGERVLSVVADVVPALRAYAQSIPRDSDDPSTVQPSAQKETLFADLAAAMQHVSALELTLHREDGSPIAVDDIAVRDADQLLSLARSEMPDFDLDDASGDSCWDAGDECEAIEDPGEISFDADELRPWTPADDDEMEFPRYQVHVVLRDDGDLP